MSRSCGCEDCRAGRERREEIRHGGITEEELPHKGPRKKTRKWCRGKLGLKHVWERQRPYDWSEIEADICTACGKHGKYYW